LYPPRIMLALPLSHAVMAQTNPLVSTCGEARTLFKDNACCSATLTKEISDLDGVCPTLDELITYPVKKGVWTPCPAEEYYMEYDANNPSAPGYKGCVSENGATPCGWMDYYEYDETTKTCTTLAGATTAIQTVRGGSPTMTADMLRLTGEDSLPTIKFSALPMTYPSVKNDPTVPEMAELSTVWKDFMAYYGSTLDLSGFTAYPSYGTEQGMVATVGIKILELVQTTCNRDFHVLLEAPAYGYDWTMSITWVDLQASSFYNGEECTCYAAGTCNSKGIITLSQNGWAPAVWATGSMPTQPGDDGMMYDPTSTEANSPWIQTNVIPGNPIGRFNPCVVPEDRCICDGVYFFPTFLSPDTVLSDFKCYSWAFSITKIYSAQMRAGTYWIKDYPAATSAASTFTNKLFAIGNGLMSHMQVHGQISLMKTIMEKPFSDPTSWLHAMALAQYEKWDVMDAAFTVCANAGIIQRAAEQQKYFGAYMFSHMSTPLMGLSENIGAASSDFFMNVIGYDHFNYNWGWRGEDATNYGIGANITSLDFHRIHMFRSYDTYAEEARRMTLACSDKNVRVMSGLLTVNEWITTKQAALAGRRKLMVESGSNVLSYKAPKEDLHKRALKIQSVAKNMRLVDAIKLAEATDPHRELKYEYGLPHDLSEVA